MEQDPFAAVPLRNIADPRLQALYDYWNMKRGDRLAPGYQDLDGLDRPEWRGHLSLLEVLEAGRDFRYQVYGGALAVYYGRDLTGKTTRHLARPVGDLVRREYAQASVGGHPVLVERRRRIRGLRIMVVKLILPLSTDEHTIDMLLAGSYPHP